MIKLIDMKKNNSFFVITESERKNLKKVLEKRQKIAKVINDSIPENIKDIAIKMFLNKAAQ